MALRISDYVIGEDTKAESYFTISHATGCVPRDFAKHPVGFYKSAPAALDMPLIPRDEWAARIKDMDAHKTRLSDLRRRSGPDGKPIPSLDQNGKGYCWAHSTTMCEILQRAKAGLPYERLSAFMVACLIKNYKDEGGWASLSLDFIAENGVPSIDFWPEKSMDPKNDTPAMRENAKLHRCTAQWADLAAAQYDRNLTEDQAMTLLLTRVPVAGDFNWWGHSVCLMDPVLVSDQKADFGSLDLNSEKDRAVYASAFGKRGINSWTDQWGDLGEFTLTGTKAHLDGGVAPRTVLPSEL